ncbi:MAG TPA: hypothetical protein VFB33_08815 [Candidatus Binataceae bacterium]|jgi:hypothetical protein|nr:hypothetical protein [Candidatus Binataceae bacterium]
MKTTAMFVMAWGGVLAVGLGALALAAEAPTVGAIQQGAAFLAATPRAQQLARHDKDNDYVEPESEPYVPPQGKRHQHNKRKAKRVEAEENYAGPFFRPAHAGYFRKCYEGADLSALPPGLQKHVEKTGHLPPGLERHLERNGTLPPGLQKRMSPANPCVLGHLGPLPPNSRLYMLGHDAYLINYHTQRILDIFRGAY